MGHDGDLTTMEHQTGKGDEMQPRDRFRQPFVVAARRRTWLAQTNECWPTQRRGSSTKPRFASGMTTSNRMPCAAATVPSSPVKP